MFINDQFMLQNKKSLELYEIIKDKKIIDYHCHLDPKIIAEDKEFKDITEMWLLGDHYKWRLMRSNGIDEKYITGNSSNFEKFKKFIETLEVSILNPVYHWCYMELKKYFGITEIIKKENAKEIYEKCNKIIKDKKYSAKKIIEMSNVLYICTTDRVIDDLKWHKKIKEDKNFKTIVSPGFRPDELFTINEEYYEFLEKLEKITNKIEKYDDLVRAIYDRIDYFDEMGCKISDHGLTYILFSNYSKKEIDIIFQKILKKEKLEYEEYKKYISSLLIDLSKKYSEKKWIMQLHFGAIRNNDELLYTNYGKDAGSDSIIDQQDLAINLNLLLNEMKKNKYLPKIIVYNLDSSKNQLVASTIYNFSTNTNIKGYLQFGAAWWFNDTKEGMINQIKTLCDYSLLNNFVGMLTDSRSFLSYVRHDYFRRIICTFIGEKVENGEIPNENDLLINLINNICYENAKNYFEIRR